MWYQPLTGVSADAAGQHRLRRHRAAEGPALRPPARALPAALVRPLSGSSISAARLPLGARAVASPRPTRLRALRGLCDPGLAGMIQLFSRPQPSLSSCSIDARPARCGRCRSPVSPLVPCSTSKLLAGVTVAISRSHAFLFIAWLWGVDPPPSAMIGGAAGAGPGGPVLGSIGLFMSSTFRELENSKTNRASRCWQATARLVDDHQRVDPHVAFGVPLRLLLAADERIHFRPQPAHDAQLASRARSR